MMLSALKSMALHGVKWHFSSLTFDARQNSHNHFGVSGRKRPFPLDFTVNFFTRVEPAKVKILRKTYKCNLSLKNFIHQNNLRNKIGIWNKYSNAKMCNLKHKNYEKKLAQGHVRKQIGFSFLPLNTNYKFFLTLNRTSRIFMNLRFQIFQDLQPINHDGLNEAIR
jgi:hypothetical protein